MKTILLFIGSLLHIHAISAQVVLDASFGVSISNIDYQNELYDPEFNHLTNLFGEVSGEYEVYKGLRFGLANQIDVRGYQTSENNEFSYRRMYWDIIPAVSVKLWSGFEIRGGWYYGVLLRDEYKGAVGVYTDISDSQDVKKRDNGLLGSLMYMYRRVGLRVQYKYGLKDIDNVLFHARNGVSLGDVQHKTRELQIGLVYRIIDPGS